MRKSDTMAVVKSIKKLSEIVTSFSFGERSRFLNIVKNFAAPGIFEYNKINLFARAVFLLIF